MELILRDYRFKHDNAQEVIQILRPFIDRWVSFLHSPGLNDHYGINRPFRRYISLMLGKYNSVGKIAIERAKLLRGDITHNLDRHELYHEVIKTVLEWAGKWNCSGRIYKNMARYVPISLAYGLRWTKITHSVYKEWQSAPANKPMSFVEIMQGLENEYEALVLYKHRGFNQTSARIARDLGVERTEIDGIISKYT